MGNGKLKIYVGCSLTHAPAAFREHIDRLKTELRKHYTVLDFQGLTKGTDQDAFKNDTQCVRDCNLFVADCTHPAIGLGYELGVALEMGKPVLAVAEKDVKVTRLVLGIERPNFRIERYANTADILRFVKEMISQ